MLTPLKVVLTVRPWLGVKWRTVFWGGWGNGSQSYPQVTFTPKKQLLMPSNAAPPISAHIFIHFAAKFEGTHEAIQG